MGKSKRFVLPSTTEVTGSVCFVSGFQRIVFRPNIRPKILGRKLIFSVVPQKFGIRIIFGISVGLFGNFDKYSAFCHPRLLTIDYFLCQFCQICSQLQQQKIVSGVLAEQCIINCFHHHHMATLQLFHVFSNHASFGILPNVRQFSEYQVFGRIFVFGLIFGLLL